MALPGGICILIMSMGSLSPVPEMVEKLQRGVADPFIAVISGIILQFFCLHKKKPLHGTGVKENRGPRDIRALALALVTYCILNWGIVGSKVTSSSLLCQVVSG